MGVWNPFERFIRKRAVTPAPDASVKKSLPTPEVATPEDTHTKLKEAGDFIAQHGTRRDSTLSVTLAILGQESQLKGDDLKELTKEAEESLRRHVNLDYEIRRHHPSIGVAAFVSQLVILGGDVSLSADQLAKLQSSRDEWLQSNLNNALSQDYSSAKGAARFAVNMRILGDESTISNTRLQAIRHARDHEKVSAGEKRGVWINFVALAAALRLLGVETEISPELWGQLLQELDRLKGFYDKPRVPQERLKDEEYVQQVRARALYSYAEYAQDLAILAAEKVEVPLGGGLMINGRRLGTGTV